MGKSKTQKRVEALERLKASRWEDSKAKRKGTMTQEQWESRKQEQLSDETS